MMSSDAEIRLLIQATQASLAPTPFPPRRDLSCAGLATRSNTGEVLFYDVFWVRRRQVCCFVIRLPGGDKRVAAAHILKALLRAAMHRYAPAQAIAASLGALRRCNFAVSDIDVAAAALRIGTGEATLATHGAGSALCLGPEQPPAAAEDGGARVQLGGDRFLWLTVGHVAQPALVEDDYARDAEELVHSALAGTHGVAAVAIGLKAAQRGREQVFMLANDIAQIGPILAEVDEYLATEGLSREARAGLDVALDEILTNVILYAYDDGQAHEIILHLSLDGGKLSVDVRDDGTPFDPTAAPAVDTSGDIDDRPIGGLGLHFVRTVFDAVGYRRLRGWNTLVLTKHLDEAAPHERASAFAQPSIQSAGRSASEAPE